jgi:hypothetical protein
VNIFLDTEFTDIVHPKLISVGLAAEDGRTLYVELDSWQLSDCSEFVKAVVVPLLSDSAVSEQEAARQVREFLLAVPDTCLWSDAPNYDVVLLHELLFALTDEEFPVPVCLLSFEDDREAEGFYQGSEKAFASGLRRHHAGDDALAALAGWRAVIAMEIPKVHEALSYDFASRMKPPPV